MDTQPLPGLSKLNEQKLRDQYTTELGTEVPAELTTRVQLIEAIKAHRNEAPDAEASEAEAPTTALDALAGQDGTAQSEPDSEVQGTDEQFTPSPDTLAEIVGQLSDEELNQVLDAARGEAQKRGLITTDSTVTDAPEPTAQAEPEPLVADEDFLIAVKQGEEPRRFSRAAWDILSANRNGWEEQTSAPAKPSDLTK